MKQFIIEILLKILNSLYGPLWVLSKTSLEDAEFLKEDNERLKQMVDSLLKISMEKKKQVEFLIQELESIKKATNWGK